ncbi:hypothetical protein ABT392_05450 [Paucibacter sp. JuS9]|uniref:hypothetical protein n=1 Tax=Paucibacter sp. JuS9 TaxID=3228748 RepID=UPI0037577BAF
MRYQFRLTKYNPELREPNGAYMLDEWTSYSDVGRSFAGVTLCEEEYLRVESAYLTSLASFLAESGIASLRIAGLEDYGTGALPPFVEAGRDLNLGECVAFSKLALRERVWAKLVRPGVAYIHFGYDFYVYLGLPRLCPAALQHAHDAGLFAEAIRSPYLRARPNLSLEPTRVGKPPLAAQLQR